MKTENKTFVVTGAGNGIGKQVLLALLERNTRVVAIDLRDDFLNELKAEIGDKAKNILVYALDITDRETVEELPQKIKNFGWQVDGVINVAGIIQPFVRINDLDYKAIERVMNVNFYGTLYMAKSFLPELLKRPEAHIVNVSSMGGFLPVPGQSVYGASKAAVKLMTEGLYAELKNSNVGVTVVFPGATKTNISENCGVKINVPQNDDSKSQKIPMLDSKKVAQLIIKGIENNKFQVYTGNDSKMMSVLYRISPKFATNLIAKQMKSLLPD